MTCSVILSEAKNDSVLSFPQTVKPSNAQSWTSEEIIETIS